MDMQCTRSRMSGAGSGFTLVELMVTLAIGAILAMMAIPSFGRLIVANRLTTTANALSDNIMGARLDAVKLNAPVQFCGSGGGSGDALANACAGQAGAVYELPQGATVGTLERGGPALGHGILATGVVSLRFSGQGIGWQDGGVPGTPYNGTVAVVCTSQLGENNQRVLSMSAGSVVSVTVATGSCS